MPKIFESGPYQFFFFSDEGDEPPHIHVRRDNANCKYWLDPISLAYNRGLSRSDLSDIRRIISENRAIFIEAYVTYHGNASPSTKTSPRPKGKGKRGKKGNSPRAAG